MAPGPGGIGGVESCLAGVDCVADPADGTEEAGDGLARPVAQPSANAIAASITCRVCTDILRTKGQTPNGWATFAVGELCEGRPQDPPEPVASLRGTVQALQQLAWIVGTDPINTDRLQRSSPGEVVYRPCDHADAFAVRFGDDAAIEVVGVLP